MMYKLEYVKKEIEIVKRNKLIQELKIAITKIKIH